MAVLSGIAFEMGAIIFLAAKGGIWLDTHFQSEKKYLYGHGHAFGCGNFYLGGVAPIKTNQVLILNRFPIIQFLILVTISLGISFVAHVFLLGHNGHPPYADLLVTLLYGEWFDGLRDICPAVLFSLSVEKSDWLFVHGRQFFKVPLFLLALLSGLQRRWHHE